MSGNHLKVTGFALSILLLVLMKKNLNLGYEVEEKKARRILVRQSLHKKSKIKENNDVDDEDDVASPPTYIYDCC